jgi:enamine deaminase RidA (YjgF/YER057c/UK114 family)
LDAFKERMMKIERIQAGPRMSQAVTHNNVVYLAGQVAVNARKGDVTAQTQDILSQIDGLLAEAGTDKSRMLTVTIWLVDMSTFAQMNKVWDAWVTPGATPARATVQTDALASDEYKIEISVTAALP